MGNFNTISSSYSKYSDTFEYKGSNMKAQNPANSFKNCPCILVLSAQYGSHMG